METIRAIVADPALPERFALREVEAPTPLRNEALVRVAAISLNRGEVRNAMNATTTTRPGWDVAGTIERAAIDGSGPRVGARVVGFLGSGAWAELVAVPTNALAELPEKVSFAQAATLPVAGLTALYALEKGGGLIDRPVLITGASGGVGPFAIELARLAGARVVGAFRQARAEAMVREAGAQEVVIGDDLAPAKAFGPYHLILESVSGASLGAALTMLAPGGTCVLFGASGGLETTFNTGLFFRTGGATLYGFSLFHEVKTHPASEGLARLVGLIADGRLHPRVEVEAPWTEIADVARQLMDRRFAGKAVLHITA